MTPPRKPPASQPPPSRARAAGSAPITARVGSVPTIARPAPRPTAGGSQWNRPLLSTIDVYVLSSFLKNYLTSLFVLVGLYVVLDMVFNFDEFVQVSGHEAGEESSGALQTVLLVADFYFFQAFRIFSYLAGIIPVVATAFTLMRMSRFNELAALLAAGVPLRRVAQPILLASLLLNGALLLVNQEVIVPSMIDKLTRDRGEAASQMEKRELRAMPDGDDAIFYASRYTAPREGQPATVEVLDVLGRIPGTQQRVHISASQATFDPAKNAWILVDGSRAIIAQPGTAQQDAEPLAEYPSTVSPETIALFVSRGDFVDLLSTNRIRQLLAQKNSVGRVDLMRVRDARWANYVLNVVLVLLTIPCVLTREPMQLRTATGRVFVLIGLCMATIFVCQSLAGQPPADPALASKWPAIMAWLPIFIFTPVAIWLLDRLKT